ATTAKPGEPAVASESANAATATAVGAKRRQPAEPTACKSASAGECAATRQRTKARATGADATTEPRAGAGRPAAGADCAIGERGGRPDRACGPSRAATPEHGAG